MVLPPHRTKYAESSAARTGRRTAIYSVVIGVQWLPAEPTTVLIVFVCSDS